MQSEHLINPYRPSAGHMPPYLAGREPEQDDFRRMLRQQAITENLIVTGLRGVGKTVLLNHLKPIALEAGWLWTGEDLTEQSSLTEERIATRIITDLSAILSPTFHRTEAKPPVGFTGKAATKKKPIGYSDLQSVYAATPGLVSDKLKAVLRVVGAMIAKSGAKGIIFAYDEAQNMADHADRQEYPLSLILDVFQSVQRSPDGLPFMLVLTGLPTLFPKLIEARTYSERMFHTIFLDRLADDGARQAISIPIATEKSPVRFDEAMVDNIVRMSGGYPYFIQFICREAFDMFVSQQVAKRKPHMVPEAILAKLDADFFSARWDTAKDTQRLFLSVVAQVPNCETEFSVSDIIRASADTLDKAYSSSSVTQYLQRLSERGLIYRGSNGKYRFAVPLLSRFIRRQIDKQVGLPKAKRRPAAS